MGIFGIQKGSQGAASAAACEHNAADLRKQLLRIVHPLYHIQIPENSPFILRGGCGGMGDPLDRATILQNLPAIEVQGSFGEFCATANLAISFCLNL